MEKRISVITPTIRKSGLPIVDRALAKQTFRDFEWLIGSRFLPKQTKHVGRSFVKEARWIEDSFKGGFWSLNRIYNKLIKHAKGELIVSWQDYTSAGPDALERFWHCYKNNKNAVVSGVGNKYKNTSFTVMVWQDPRIRKDQGSFYECYPWDVEANFCACPREAFYKVGGFDEEMDFTGYGFDARGVFERLDMLGKYKFYLDQLNESFSIPHSRKKGWDTHNMINKWADYKKEMVDKGRYPVLKYLSKDTKSNKTKVRHI